MWSSCGTELGATAVADRPGQIEPKVLFTVDAQLYKGKAVNVLSNVEKIAKEIPSLERINYLSTLNIFGATEAESLRKKGTGCRAPAPTRVETQRGAGK